LYAVRELARSGVPVLGIGSAGEPGLRSRYLATPGRRWQSSDPVELLDRLMSVAMYEGFTRLVLFPTNDAYIEFIHDHREILAERFTFASAYEGLATSLMDKRRFYETCRDHGVPVPRMWLADSKSDLVAMAGVVPYPCILKPLLIHRAKKFLAGGKVLLATTPSVFREMIGRIPPDTGSWLVQEIIPGPESEIALFGAYFKRDGKAVQEFTGRKLRQYPPGFGSASLVVSEPIRAVSQATANMLEALRFNGVCGSEFKFDSRDGVLKMIEINPRPTLWFQATHAAGKRIMTAAFRDLIGEAMPPESPMVPSVVWRYSLKDLSSSLFYRFRSQSFVFACPDVSRSRNASLKTWAVFDREDPVPAIAEVFRYLRRWSERW
jgi:D-aspartate ligase